MTWFWEAPFTYFFRGRTTPGRFTQDMESMRQWAATDYCVIYTNFVQRGRVPSELLDHLAQMSPEIVIRIQGMEYARIYRVRNTPLPAYLLKARFAQEKE
jgi:hypothetical protein